MGRHLCPSLALVLGHDVRGVDGKTSVGVDCDTEKPGVSLKENANLALKNQAQDSILWIVVYNLYMTYICVNIHI